MYHQYVCIYVYICVYIYMCLCIHIYICVCIHIYVYLTYVHCANWSHHKIQPCDCLYAGRLALAPFCTAARLLDLCLGLALPCGRGPLLLSIECRGLSTLLGRLSFLSPVADFYFAEQCLSAAGPVILYWLLVAQQNA